VLSLNNIEKIFSNYIKYEMKILVQEDCYFFVDENIPENIRPMSALCVECHKNKEVGWFWEGSSRGYYIYDIKCSVCGKDIYKIEKAV
jgi:hypothetical protein